jgi:starch synthase
MTAKKKILFVSQETQPFLQDTEISRIARNLPQGIHEAGKEIRVFMPKYGCINERRHQLHEVIRLSGMNLIIDDSDHPLIIKVASIPTARMQVYFIDNEEYFKRKAVLADDKGEFFEDNDERSMFFCKGVLETVKKLGWAPDIIHCHGWLTAMMPLYVKKQYADDPHFADTKVVYSAYDSAFKGSLNPKVAEKLTQDGFSEEDVELLKDPTFVNLNTMALNNSDAAIWGSSALPKEIEEYLKGTNRPVLEFQAEDDYIREYSEFYDKVLAEDSVLVN